MMESSDCIPKMIRYRYSEEKRTKPEGLTVSDQLELAIRVGLDHTLFPGVKQVRGPTIYNRQGEDLLVPDKFLLFDLWKDSLPSRSSLDQGT